MIEQQEMQRLFDHFVQGWNDQDIATMSACFSPSGDLISTEGRRASGRQAIVDLLSSEWAKTLRGTQASMTVLSRRPLRPGLVLVDANMEIEGSLIPNGKLRMHLVILAVKSRGEWWFEAARPYVPYTKTVLTSLN